MFTKSKQDNSWSPLVNAFEKLITELSSSKRTSFNLSLVIQGYEPAPYMQGSLNKKGDLVVEIVSDDFLEPNLTSVQKAWLNSLGWAMPDGGNPNYSRVYLAMPDKNLLAKQLIATLRIVFNLQRENWFFFGDSEEDIAISSSQDFWHHIHNSSVVCLPQQNKTQTFEGVLAA